MGWRPLLYTSSIQIQFKLVSSIAGLAVMGNITGGVVSSKIYDVSDVFWTYKISIYHWRYAGGGEG